MQDGENLNAIGKYPIIDDVREMSEAARPNIFPEDNEQLGRCREPFGDDRDLR